MIDFLVSIAAVLLIYAFVIALLGMWNKEDNDNSRR